MKKLLGIALCALFANNVCMDMAENKIKFVDYDKMYEEALLDIAFQDPVKFFPEVPKIALTQPIMLTTVLEDSQNALKKSFADPLRIIRVLIDNQLEVAIGFVICSQDAEHSMEAIKTMTEAQGMQFDENEYLMLFPHAKKTDADCTKFAKIECLAVSQNHRRKGYGKMLLRQAIACIKDTWSDISHIELVVLVDNSIAIKLYESEGFKKSTAQSLHIQSLHAAQYDKIMK